MKEIWKDVPIKPFNQNYQVSNLGRVRSKTHVVMQRHGNTISPHTYRGKILTQDISNGTHTHPKAWNLHAKRVTMTCHDKRGRFLVHRLVAKAFIPNPYHYPMVNHKDRNEKHNWVSNLEWCTQRYNNYYGGAMERTANGESRPCALLTNNIEYDFLSVPQAAIYLHINLGLSKSKQTAERSISRVCCHDRKQTFGFKAKYLERSVIDDDLY